MYHVIERSNSCQMDLSTLPIRCPLLQVAPLLDLPLDFLVQLSFNLHRLDATPLSSVNLPSKRLVVIRRMDLHRVQALLCNGNDCAPPEFHSEVPLGVFVNTTPNRFDVDVIRAKVL